MFSVIFALTLCSFAYGGAVPRVYGGTSASIINYPYEASFQHRGEQWCGGAIISPDWVLTAAHCLLDTTTSTVQVRVGSSYIHEGGIIHNVSQFFPHPEYDANTFAYDIALIKISTPFEYSDVVQPIPLAEEDPEVGTQAIFAGWGVLDPSGTQPSQLQQTHPVIVSREECQENYGDYFGNIDERVICAGKSQNVCGGDSGGPLVVNGKVVGVVSWGVQCGLDGFPEVYIDVPTFREWISSITQIV